MQQYVIFSALNEYCISKEEEDGKMMEKCCCQGNQKVLIVLS